MSTSSFFNHILPPPKFITMPSVGVDISDTSLKYIGLMPDRRAEGTFKLKTWGEVKIAEGAISRGEIQEVAVLTKALKEFKAKTKADFIRLSLPEEKAYIFETEVKISSSITEMRGQIEFRLEENVPLPGRDIIFDYEIIPHQREASSRRKVIVTAYPAKVVNHYYEACLQSEVTPVSFEVEGAAMARAVIPRAETRGTYMVVDYGKTRIGLGVIYNGVLAHASSVDYGGDRLSAGLRRVLGEDKPETELTKLKNEQGLIPTAVDSEVAEVLLSTVSAARDDISQHIQYWHNLDLGNPERRIKEIILCGGTANLKGLPEYLTETLHINVSRANVWQNAFSYQDFIPPIDLNHSYGYASAIGLALNPRFSL